MCRSIRLLMHQCMKSTPKLFFLAVIDRHLQGRKVEVRNELGPCNSDEVRNISTLSFALLIIARDECDILLQHWICKQCCSQ